VFDGRIAFPPRLRLWPSIQTMTTANIVPLAVIDDGTVE
jgi:hypothetical protein